LETVPVAKQPPKVKKVVLPKPVKAAMPKPAPVERKAAPTVLIAYGGDVKTREAKGFSLSELKAAGVTKVQALKAGLRVDAKRASSHEKNVELLAAIKPKAG
jgi:ribosomal protein L13E